MEITFFTNKPESNHNGLEECREINVPWMLSSYRAFANRDPIVDQKEAESKNTFSTNYCKCTIVRGGMSGHHELGTKYCEDNLPMTEVGQDHLDVEVVRTTIIIFWLGKDDADRRSIINSAAKLGGIIRHLHLKGLAMYVWARSPQLIRHTLWSVWLQKATTGAQLCYCC